MNVPLLLTKLYIPPARTDRVLRSRLVERLNESIRCTPGVILVSAPAGFGKTTLVSEWIRGCGLPAAWLSLDEEDSDLSRFLLYFIAALQTIQAGIGAGVLAGLHASQPQLPPNESVLTTLLNEIAALPDSFILVLDDTHVLDSQPVDQALAFLVEHMPRQMHLVITTREDPHLPLARLRARGHLNELRAADLRFTTSEAADYLNRMMGLNLKDADIAALEARTEGWIAGLQLAALSMQNRQNITGFIQTFTGSHRFVLDYLVEEVLLHQSETIRSFLLQTAVLDRFCAPLCDAVTASEGSKELLEVLERSNLFLIPLDDKREWFRYHHLFAEVLQTHWNEVQPDRVSALHSRASAWYEHNGLRSDAIRHALAAKDFERAAGLVELAWPAAEEGTISQVVWLGWVKMLPAALLHARPVLNVCYAYTLLRWGEIEAAEARFNDADRWVKASGRRKGQVGKPPVEMVIADHEQWKSLPATIAIGRAYIAQSRGNTQETVRYARQVLELVPEGSSYRHSQAAMMLGMTYWASGNLIAANRVFADYTQKLRAAGNIPDAISTTVVLGEIRLALGHLQEAIRTIEQLLRYVMDQGEPITPHTADLHRELGELYLEQGQLEAAAQQFQRSKDLGEQDELPVWRYRWQIAQARLHSTQGDQDRALALLDEAERLFIRTPLPDSRPIPAAKARVWLLQGRLAQALEWAQEQKISPDDELIFLREYDYLTLARVLIARYHSDRMEDTFHAATRLLDRLLKAAEEGNRLGSVIEILVLLGLAYQGKGDTMTAIASLERALKLAEPENYVRVFLDEGRPMAELLSTVAAVLEEPRIIEYIRKLLTTSLWSHFAKPSFPLGTSELSPAIKQSNGPQPLIEHAVKPEKHKLVEPLSERELDVLRLLRTEMSGPEMARELMVSLNTVRTHTQNIYAKLGVNNRRAAIRRAEELLLL